MLGNRHLGRKRSCIYLYVDFFTPPKVLIPFIDAKKPLSTPMSDHKLLGGMSEGDVPTHNANQRRKPMASYYKTIDGVDYDREILETAETAVAGQGDGRISLNDAEKLLAAVKDGNEYTDIEQRSMKYVRDNYKFTDEAKSQSTSSDAGVV